MPVTQFLHTALNVTDLDRAEHFYGAVLGLTKVRRDLTFPGVWYQIGDHQIHLIVAPEVTSSGQHEKWGRNRHLALAIDNLDAIKALLTQQGYSYQMSASGRPALFVKDPDGNIIELGQV
jgi:catechol 2,3-dioxygenase-like lactoylglutathione lyase family enzyme